MVFRHFEDLDAVFDSDTCDNLRQVIYAFRARLRVACTSCSAELAAAGGHGRRGPGTIAVPGACGGLAKRLALGILSLTRSYDNARVEVACRRGIHIKARSVASIRSIIKSGPDRAFLDETSDRKPPRHGNIRGQGYFH